MKSERSGRCRPVVVSTRVTVEERRVLEAAAVADGLSVAELVHGATVTAARQRLAQLADLGLPQDPSDDAGGG